MPPMGYFLAPPFGRAREDIGMDRDKVKALREKMNEALSLIEKDCGVKFEVGSASYLGAHATFKVEVSEVAADGTVVTRAAEEWKRHAALLGLPEDGLGKKIMFRGAEYEIVGLHPDRPRYPIEVKRAKDGKGFKMALKMVLPSLHKAGGKTGAKPGAKRPDAEIIKELQEVHCGLSPESLTCDGELPRREVERRRRELTRRQIMLEAELGRVPTDKEIWGP